MTILRECTDIFWVCVALIGVPLWVWGVVSSRLVISDLGIINSFPIVFWLAIGLLLISYVGLALSKRPRQGYLALIFAILLVSLWLVPHLLGASQQEAAHQWGKNGEFIGALMESGRLDPQLLWYHNWPGVWIIVVAAQYVTGIGGLPGELTLDLLTPAAIQVVFALFVFTLFRTLWGSSEKRWVWLSLLVFLAANWSSQNYLSPQAYGLALLILVMWAIVRLAQSTSPYRETSLSAVAVVLIAGVAVSHLPTTGMLLASLVLIYLGFHIFQKGASPLRAEVVGIATIIIVTWNLQWALQSTTHNLPAVMEAFFDLASLFQFGIAEHLVGDAPHATLSRFRLLYSALWVTVALAGTAVALLDRRMRPPRVNLLVMSALAAGAGIVPLAAGGAMTELAQRAQFLLTLPIAFFTVYLLRYRVSAPLLILVLLVSPVAVLIGYYGDQRADYLAPDHRAAVEFFHLHAPTGTVVTRHKFQTAFGQLSSPGVHQVVSAHEIALVPSTPSNEKRGNGTFVVLTDTDYQYARFFGLHVDEYDAVSQYVAGEGKYNHVFASPTVSIYTDQ